MHLDPTSTPASRSEGVSSFHAEALSTIQEAQALVLERYAERATLAIRRAPNFTQCLTNQHLSADITVLDRRGKLLTLHGKDLYNQRAWHKFVASTQLPISTLCSLVWS